MADAWSFLRDFDSRSTLAGTPDTPAQANDSRCRFGIYVDYTFLTPCPPLIPLNDDNDADDDEHPMADLAELDKTRQSYRAKLATALNEDEDPLAEYERFVKWTIESYPPELVPKSGLLELLEEATRQFKDDEAYKSDLRYTKLWMLYAAYVDDEKTHAAVPIYKFLVKNNVGMAYAQVYEEYAAALERADRCAI